MDVLQPLREEHEIELPTVQALDMVLPIATDALLQRHGGKTALTTTAGLRDALEIGWLGRLLAIYITAIHRHCTLG